MNQENPQPARSFGSVAAEYDTGRPDYPDEAVRWLTGGEALTVLELGAGTGKLTEDLVRHGHDVHATDPDPQMLSVLRTRCPDVRTDIATAEAIPAEDRSYDVVVAAQAFHWFDAEQALPEIARVLKPGGHLALVWNVRDERIPWVRRLGRIIGSQEALHSVDPVIDSDLFAEVATHDVTHWQHVDRVTIADLVTSRSPLVGAGDQEREGVLAQVRALYDEYGRGMDGMELPYRAFCYRAAVAGPGTPGADGERHVRQDGGPVPPPADGDTGEFLLIDFR